MSNSKWEEVENIDFKKRKPNEWAAIYKVKIFGYIPDELWSEYEWAYNLTNLKYMLLPDRDEDGDLLDTFEKSEEMEMRAIELKRDIFTTADMGEKLVLNDKFIETDWINKKLLMQ